jgi:chromosome segregation ATPase
MSSSISTASDASGMDVEAQNALGKFMAALTNKNQENFNTMLQEKLAIIAKLEIDLTAANTENVTNKAKLCETESALEASKKSHSDDKVSLFSKLNEAENAAQSMRAQLKAQQQSFQGESEQRSAGMRQLETECSRLRVESSTSESKLESLASEMNELHSAMASLHGEISVLQRELDDVQEKERKTSNQKKEISLMLEMKEADLVKIKIEKEKMEVKNSTLDIKLTDANDKIRAFKENQNQLDNLLMERDSQQSVINQMEGRLHQQTSTNQELNGLLNKLHGDIQRLQQELNDSHDESAQIGEHAKQQEEKFRGEIQVLQVYKTDLDAANTEARKECESILADMTLWKERGESLQGDQRKQAKRIEKLEREKHELFIELGQKAKDCEAFSTEIQSTQASNRDSKLLYDELKAEHDLLKKKLISTEDDVEKLQYSIRDIKDAAHEKESKLREETARCEQVIESSRSQQRENANRVVDFSQKNAKLTADLTLAQDELDKMKAKISSTDELVSAANEAKEESIRQHNATRVRLQSLEDTVEELGAKLEGAEAEADDCRRLHQEGSEARAREAGQQRQTFDQELRRAKETFQTELDEKTLAAANSRRQGEQHAERTVARARETFQRQIEELQAIRKREQGDFTSRTAAITSAMEGLQRELREESIKSTAASEELFSLREQLEGNAREDDSSERMQRLEREKARDRVKHDGVMQALKDDMQSLGDKLDRAEQQCGLLEQRCSHEKEQKAALLSKYRRLEEELNAQANAYENANQDSAQYKKQLRDMERKAAASLNAKEAEIQRLTRRGEVLSEAVNRLTAGGAGPAVKTSISSPSPSANGFANSFAPDNSGASSEMLFDSTSNIAPGTWSDSAHPYPSDEFNPNADYNADYNDTGNYNGTTTSPPTADAYGDSLGNTHAPPPNQPAYQSRREAPYQEGNSGNSGNKGSNAGPDEFEGDMPPPRGGGAGADVNAHLQRVQDALNRRRNGNNPKSSNAISGSGSSVNGSNDFGRGLLRQASGAGGEDTPSGRSTAPQLSVHDDDDLSRASNEEVSSQRSTARKKRNVSAPGFLSPSNQDRRAHQTTNSSNMTPNSNAKQAKGVSFDGTAPSQFLSEGSDAENNGRSMEGENPSGSPRPSSGDSGSYVHKMRENIELYHNPTSPSPSPARNKGGGITYLVEGGNQEDDKKNMSKKPGSGSKPGSKSDKTGTKSKKSSTAASKLASKAYA